MAAKKPRILAMYLPQFHRIPENDKWWGEGFTEWTNTRKAKSLFKGHYQPKVPLGKNYYNVLDSKVRNWQAKIARKYGIFGFCYYHYYFNGKILLEKPAELMLKEGSPDFPFCFSWANETWQRTWYSAKRETLIKQTYGEEKEWKVHFYYLLDFFKDKRYIKINNKPLFVILKPHRFKHLDKMIVLWNKLAKEEGFSGIHIVETLSKTQKEPFCKFSEAVYPYEPGFTISNFNFLYLLFLNLKIQFSKFVQDKLILEKIFQNEFMLNKFDYGKTYKKLIDKKLQFKGKKTYYGSFVSFDDTARRKYRAFIFSNFTIKKFELYFTRILEKSRRDNSDYLFITAWNEWAEGAYLEPDEKSKFKVLETIKKCLEKF